MSQIKGIYLDLSWSNNTLWWRRHNSGCTSWGHSGKSTSPNSIWCPSTAAPSRVSWPTGSVCGAALWLRRRLYRESSTQPRRPPTPSSLPSRTSTPPAAWEKPPASPPRASLVCPPAIRQTLQDCQNTHHKITEQFLSQGHHCPEHCTEKQLPCTVAF